MLNQDSPKRGKPFKLIINLNSALHRHQLKHKTIILNKQTIDSPEIIQNRYSKSRSHQLNHYNQFEKFKQNSELSEQKRSKMKKCIKTIKIIQQALPKIKSPINNNAKRKTIQEQHNISKISLSGMIFESQDNMGNMNDNTINSNSNSNSNSNTPSSNNILNTILKKSISNNLHLKSNKKVRETLQKNNEIIHPIEISTRLINDVYENYHKVKCSSSSIKHIKAYSVNTYQGIVRNYNEDRVAISMNIKKPLNYTGDTWPECSYFGVFDGHSGHLCCDFLRDNLLRFIIESVNFNTSVDEAILDGFNKAEKTFLLNHALDEQSSLINSSGSCALIALVVDDKCYIANVGDSRAILSMNKGIKSIQVTTDHKPNDPKEKHRIKKNGGSVFKSMKKGIYRVQPGLLSVSRTFGDAGAKVPSLGGNPGVIVPTPDIYSFRLNASTDFLVLCSDGICDTMNSKDIILCPWMIEKEYGENNTVHTRAGLSADLIIKSALARKTHDNVTCVFISFNEHNNNNNNSNDDDSDNGMINPHLHLRCLN